MKCNAGEKIDCSTKKFLCFLNSKVEKNENKLIKSQNIKTGDLLLLKKGQRVPADCALVFTTDPDGIVFMKTDQLDGETDWKVREAMRSTQIKVQDKNQNEFNFSNNGQGSRPNAMSSLKKSGAFDRGHSLVEKNSLLNLPLFSSLFEYQWRLKIEPPNDRIYEFNGMCSDENSIMEPLRISNIVLANMSVASTDILVIVIYVGKETKMSQNSKTSIEKFGKTDQDMNNAFITIFFICLILSTLMFLISGIWNSSQWKTELLRIFLLLSSILPFMLKLNSDIAKLYYSYSIQEDQSIAGTIVRNRQIPEELGRVEYLLCDKTGTLTKNEMLFKQLITFAETYGMENMELIENELADFYDIQFEQKSRFLTEESDSKEKEPRAERFYTQSRTFRKKLNKEERRILIDAILAMLLCNNVSPSFTNNVRILQASSPDEVSLVEYAESLGFEIVSRKLDSLVLKLPNEKTQSFKILQNFPFSSERKRMGIILKNIETNEIKFLMKGADSIMQTFFDEKSQIHISEKSTLLSNQGLRTLVVGQRTISESEYEQFKIKMLEAQNNLKLRTLMEEKCVNEIEKNLEFLCVTGVEDLLQENVKQVISSIREAGINVWLLTGDKLETAKCIAVSTGFKNYQQRFHEIIDGDEESIMKRLREFNPVNALVVSGDCLEKILKTPSLNDEFFANSLFAKSVILCRCAPKQKAEIALIIKNRFSKVVAAIGDGGNDVGMIQSASIGIGIEGREGLQASLASDYSITDFQNVLQLFLWHGRMSFVRTSKLAGLVIHRAILFVAVQYLFMCMFYFVTIRIYNSYLCMFYGTLFTNLIVFSVIFDTDIPKHQTLNYPSLYKLVQNGGDSSFKSMMIWKLQGFYQGSVIILFALKLFPNLFSDIHTITFTALIFIEYLNIYTVITTWNRKMTFAMIVSVLGYLICLFPLRTFVELSPLTFSMFAKIMLLVGIGWLPAHISYLIQLYCFPTPVQKLINEANIQAHRKKIQKISRFKTQFQN